MAKSCVINTIAKTIISNAKSYEVSSDNSRIFIPTSKFGSKQRTYSVAKSLIQKANKAFDPNLYGESVSMDNTFSDGTAVHIHPSDALIYAYDLKEGKMSRDSYNENYTNAKQDIHPIKEGVDFVFEQNPELASIGTLQQYSQYLDTIFPNTKVKDIVYHGTTQIFDIFDSSKRGSFSNSKSSTKGYFFTSNKREAEIYSRQGVAEFNKGSLMPDYNFSTGRVLHSILDIKNPKIISDESILDDSEEKEEQLNIYVEDAINENKDSFIWNANVENYESGNIEDSDEIVVFEPEQIHILGSKQDIEGFKNHIKNNSNTKSVPTFGVFMQEGNQYFANGEVYPTYEDAENNLEDENLDSSKDYVDLENKFQQLLDNNIIYQIC